MRWTVTGSRARERAVYGEVLGGADDLGALDGSALAAVPGQRVRELEMVGDIVGRQLAQLAVVGLDRHRQPAGVYGLHGPPGAVVDVVLAVVSARDDAVAHRHLQASELHSLAQLAPALPPGPSLLVEARARGVVAGDHDRLFDPHPFNVGPPGGHGRLLGRLRAAVVNHQRPPPLFEPDPGVRPVLVQLGQCSALGGVALPHNLAQLVCTQPLRKRAEPPARRDARQLARVPDRHHLYALAMGGGKHARADPGRGHPGLVDQQHRRSRSESLAVAQILDQSMQRARWHAGAARQLARRPPGRCRPHHPIARAPIDRRQRPRHRGLARPSQRLDHIHPIPARCDVAHRRCLFVTQPRGERSERILDHLRRDCSRAGALAAHGVENDPSLARQQTVGGVALSGFVRNGDDVAARQEPFDRAADLLGFQAVGMRGGELSHRVARFEAVALRGQPGRPGQQRSRTFDIDGPRRGPLTIARQCGQLVLTEPVLGRLRPHPFAPWRQRHRVVLRLAGGQRGLLRRLPPRPILGLQPLEDLGPPARKVGEHATRHALEFGHPVAHLAPPGPGQPLAHRRPQVRLIERAGGLGVLEDRIPMQCRPSPILSTGEVGRHHVRV